LLPDAAMPFRTVAQLLRDYRAQWPGKPAIVDVDNDVAITFGQLAVAVDSVAAQLSARGLQGGSRIVLLAENGIDKLILWLAAWRIAAVVCPLDLRFLGPTADKVTTLIEPDFVIREQGADAAPACDAPQAVFAGWGPDGPRAASADMLRVDLSYAGTLPDVVHPGDVACLICTSGTTGMPKVVIHDHAAYWLNGLAAREFLDLDDADRMLEYRSLSWSSAQILSLMPFLQTGLTLYVAKRFSRSRFPGWVQRYGITASAGVPTVINLLVAEPVTEREASLASLRRITCSTAPLSADQGRRFEALYGPRLINLYGTSEAGWICGHRYPVGGIGTVGRPSPYMDFRIVDADGVAVPAGVEGQIVVAGAKLAIGLLRAGGAIEAIRGAPLKTRDLGFVDDEGFVHITGRTDDLIVRGGAKISPLEIDEVVLRHPGVLDAAAIGVPDAVTGEEPVCFVVARPDRPCDEAELLVYCARHLPREKVPKQIFIVDALPRSDRGKLLRDELRTSWWAAMQQRE
jgi:acyl-CoA synthetase (AMP-forming)/AMP-acid ligase II